MVKTGQAHWEVERDTERKRRKWGLRKGLSAVVSLFREWQSWGTAKKEKIQDESHFQNRTRCSQALQCTHSTAPHVCPTTSQLQCPEDKDTKIFGEHAAMMTRLGLLICSLQGKNTLHFWPIHIINRMMRSVQTLLFTFSRGLTTFPYFLSITQKASTQKIKV